MYVKHVLSTSDWSLTWVCRRRSNSPLPRVSIRKESSEVVSSSRRALLYVSIWYIGRGVGGRDISDIALQCEGFANSKFQLVCGVYACWEVWRSPVFVFNLQIPSSWVIGAECSMKHYPRGHVGAEGNYCLKSQARWQYIFKSWPWFVTIIRPDFT
jgi:hypothetical protein